MVTWLGNGNYGTSLQSFALHKILQKYGYNVSFLQNIPRKFTYKNQIKLVLSLLGIDLCNIKDLLISKEWSIKDKKIKAFIKANYNLIKINSQKQKKDLLQTTDTFITGSDQIWNTQYSFNPYYFLDFADNKKKIAYASSMGISDFPEEHKAEVKRLLLKFCHIGVREKTALESISKLLNRNDIQQVLDPTFLLNNEEWTTISNNAYLEFKIPQKYILCYLIGNNSWYKEDLRQVCSILGIKDLIIIPAIENKDFQIEGAFVYNEAGPLEFIKLIKEASFICTDSFHATAMAINFQKDFVEFIRFKDADEVSQNSRIYDLLNHYRLSSRIYSENTEWFDKIAYNEINKQLEIDRKNSLNFLLNSIEN